MRVAEGDVIGTKDGRYGKVAFLVTQDWFLVDIFPQDVNEPAPNEPEQAWLTAKDVASIV